MPTIARSARKAADRDRPVSGLVIAAGCTVRTLALKSNGVTRRPSSASFYNLACWTSELLRPSQNPYARSSENAVKRKFGLPYGSGRRQQEIGKPDRPSSEGGEVATPGL